MAKSSWAKIKTQVTAEPHSEHTAGQNHLRMQVGQQVVDRFFVQRPFMQAEDF